MSELNQRLSAIEAVTGRRSMRSYSARPIYQELIEEILEIASRAPSGTNAQPWKVHIVTGDARERISQAVIAAAKAGEYSDEYAYAPNPWWEPFISRRRKVGYDLYSLYGIERSDMAARTQAALRNYEFFGAPVGLFFAMERALTYGSWLDVGMYMQNVMTIARSFGLDTCAQQAWCNFGGLVRRQLGIDDKYVLIAGMALGFADHSAPENGLITDRQSVEEFATFHRS